MKPWEDSKVRVGDVVRDVIPATETVLNRGVGTVSRIEGDSPAGCYVRWDNGPESWIGYGCIEWAKASSKLASDGLPDIDDIPSF